jgi:hypothetical protein
MCTHNLDIGARGLICDPAQQRPQVIVIVLRLAMDLGADRVRRR